MIGWGKRIKEQNALLSRYEKDVHFRVLLSLYASLAFGGGYALLQLGLGVYHRSVWFFAFAAYYALLFLMRFSLLKTLKGKKTGGTLLSEMRTARLCGICLLVITPPLAVIVFYIVFQGRAFSYHPIITIAMAAYTFTSFVFAIINVVKYRRYNSPVYSATKAISFASACVSMLTLTSTMLTTFDDGTMGTIDKKWILGCTGVAVLAVVVAMAIRMIVKATKQLKEIKTEVEKG
jgi:hypothetical protein